MHWIQKYILRELIVRGEARYSELKHPKVESNLFLYHLKALIKENFVKKEGKTYQLSDEGLRFANFYSHEMDGIRLQPKILNAVVCYDGDRVLVYRRGVEPFKGKIALVNGKLHFGEESLLDAAKRELQEKAGLKAEKIKHANDTYLRYMDDDGCFNHVLSHNFLCSSWSGNLRKPALSQLLWMTPDELREHPDTLPGTVEILELMKEDKFLLAELTFTVSPATAASM